MPSELLVNALAGGASGIAVDAILFPLDTIKTRLQAARAASGAAARSPPSGGFYRGLASAMLGSFPAAATFWTAYNAAKAHLVPLVPDHAAFLAHAGAAAAADVAVCTVRNPFEVVKQQMQAGMHAGRGTRAAAAAIVRADGLRGLYAGWLSTVAREIPFDALEFGAYEAMKGRLAGQRRRELVLWENAALGCVAGGLAAGVTTPLDVIKTRLMTQTGRPASERYAGWADAARRIHAEEGWGGLFAGIRPRVTWIALGGAVFIGSFEELKRRLSPPQPPPPPVSGGNGGGSGDGWLPKGGAGRGEDSLAASGEMHR